MFIVAVNDATLLPVWLRIRWVVVYWRPYTRGGDMWRGIKRMAANNAAAAAAKTWAASARQRISGGKWRGQHGLICVASS